MMLPIQPPDEFAFWLFSESRWMVMSGEPEGQPSLPGMMPTSNGPGELLVPEADAAPFVNPILYARMRDSLRTPAGPPNAWIFVLSRVSATFAPPDCSTFAVAGVRDTDCCGRVLGRCAWRAAVVPNSSEAESSETNWVFILQLLQ